MPVEEITDRGYALAVVCYTDMLGDKLHGDFSDGLVTYFGVTKDRGLEELGKVALWAVAQDERFWCVISNDSGYGGAATYKHGTGERVRDFLRGGSWDFYCENFKEFVDEKEMQNPITNPGCWL